MTRRPAAFSQSDVKRAVEGAKSAGMKVVAVEIAPDGRILVIGEGGRTEPPADRSWDDFDAR